MFPSFKISVFPQMTSPMVVSFLIVKIFIGFNLPSKIIFEDVVGPFKVKCPD